MKKLWIMLSDKIFAFVFLFVISFSLVQSYDEIINLGGDCQVQYQLNINGLRKYALPFDILITPHQALCGILKNDFENFMTPDNFELIVNAQGEKYILDKKYGTRLIHDFKLEQDFLKDYPEIEAKYQRRIDRFKELVMNSEYPVFIRKKITKEQAIELRAVLSEIRSGRPFLLVALDGSDEIKTDWQLERISNHHLRQTEPYSWKGHSQAWKEIFYAIGLLQTFDVQVNPS